MGLSELEVLKSIMQQRFIKYNNPNAAGVRLRESAVYPGKSTNNIVYRGDVLPYDEKNVYKYKEYSITFYRLIDGSGWIHNFNSTFPSALNATIELEPTFKKIDLSKTAL
eukprot:TRINITY_DN8192_c0_g1_i1.p1 TRINITY_DN8192_c0_g1~~TRINITY_DN8192_c0_g1_i1.p1  ORF type:complete len:124 (+),score=14.10 TRINITY_DN8192_c0_g1_i1:43-372(+)